MTDLAADFSWDSSAGAAVITAVFFAVLFVVSFIVNRVAARVFDEREQRYNARRISRAILWFVAILGVIVIWQPLGGSLAPALGLATAGLAFAMQEAVGAVAGWFNITFGSIFRVGDRVKMGGVQGDVIDISLLKTRLMEIGDNAETTWVGGRQYTGRVVTVSNKATFTEPVYNYSGFFEYIWEEVAVAIPHHADWQGASRILEEEARRQETAEGARQAMETVRKRFPVPDTEVEPKVFASADETYMRLAVRFVVPVRTARTVKDAITRRIHRRLADAGVEVVATQVVQQARTLWEPIDAEGSDSEREEQA